MLCYVLIYNRLNVSELAHRKHLLLFRHLNSGFLPLFSLAASNCRNSGVSEWRSQDLSLTAAVSQTLSPIKNTKLYPFPTRHIIICTVFWKLKAVPQKLWQINCDLQGFPLNGMKHIIHNSYKILSHKTSLWGWRYKFLVVCCLITSLKKKLLLCPNVVHHFNLKKTGHVTPYVTSADV